MNSSKIFLTIISLIVTILALTTFTAGDKPIRENFWGAPGFKALQLPVVSSDNGKVQHGVQQNYNGDMYQTAGQWQSQLSPRFFSESYGANISYNPPSIENMAVPCNPLTFNNMTRENYAGCGSCSGSPANCSVGGSQPPGNTDSGHGQTEMQSQAARGALESVPTSSELPSGDMQSIDASGDMQNAIVYQRYIFANQKSRYWQNGDPIRGDLPIVPSQTGWFRPSVHPNIDLRSGALAAMGGNNNDTAQQLYNLQIQSSGGSNTAEGGENLSSLNTGAQGAVSNSLGDVQFTAFP